MDHVPPKQFYLKELRSACALNLWKVPAHKRCNEAYREDEEYFLHASFPLVTNANPEMRQLFDRELRRRAAKPQTQAMLRRLRRDFRRVTRGGLYMPRGMLVFELDKWRIQRVAIKIAQGLFFREFVRFLPRENCKDFRLSEHPTDVPELYRISWHGASAETVLPEVFSYRRLEFEDMQLLSLLFWKSFMVCMAFESPFVAVAPGG